MSEALIICNGNPPSEGLLLRHWERVDWRIAADGGANVLSRLGLTPDVVVGDLDSLHPELRERLPAESLIRIVEQETNDADKAIRFSLEKGAECLHIFGAEGGRSDQFLANLDVLYKYSTQARLILWTELERCEFVRDLWQETLSVGATVSLFPLFGPVEGITTEGLEYALTDQVLTPGTPPSGVSNRAVSSRVSVQVRAGSLLVMASHL
jgi:thiamine pyrophosphokinase